MKGDFSRIRFNRQKNYTAVLQQQGRVALDADHNEQSFIDDYLRTSEIVDVVGDYGAPAGDAGFEITVVGGELAIGAGRYYVAGLMCDNAQVLSYDGQPYLIDPSFTGTELLAILARSGGNEVLQVYLEVWQRLVTDLDDPCLREPALGRADTTARLQTVWRVAAELQKTAATEGNPGSSPSGMTPCCQQMYVASPHTSTGMMSAGTGGPSADCGCEPVAAAGYQGIENQLYRVEIHTPGDQTTATFKWSRENGSVRAAITGISGATLQLNTLGPDANLGFQEQQWIELIDDTYVFGDVPNKAGPLYQIQTMHCADLSLTLTTPVTGIDVRRNPRIRRWDQSGPTAGAAGTPLSAGSQHQLENGIEVQFRSGAYRTGDYWTIPARTASGQLDWPPCSGDGNAFQPPQSVRVHRAPLACVHWSPAMKGIGQTELGTPGQFTWDDCRQIFGPLTSVPITQQAIHVTKTSWANDTIMPIDQLANGLTITLDQTPTSPVTGANFIVTAEWAIEPQTPIVRYTTVIDAAITVSGDTLRWSPPDDIVAFLEELLSREGASLARVRVKMIGQMIFAKGASGPIFLDGRAFGRLAGSDTTPQIDLKLPSGEGATASDLDSWFYLAPPLKIISVTCKYQELFIVEDELGEIDHISDLPPEVGQGHQRPVTPEATVTTNYPASATIALNIDPPGVVSVPATVQLEGRIANTFGISVFGSPGSRQTATFTLTATLRREDGTTSSQIATFTVTGGTPQVK